MGHSCGCGTGYVEEKSQCEYVNDCVLSFYFVLQFQHTGPPTITRLTVKSRLENLYINHTDCPGLTSGNLGLGGICILKTVLLVILEHIQV